METVSFIIGDDRSSTFLLFALRISTAILATPDLFLDSIEDEIGAREGPVKHNPNTTYVQQYLNSDSLTQIKLILTKSWV